MDDKVSFYLAEFSALEMVPDEVHHHPATVSIIFGEFEVDVHPTCVLLFRNGNLIGDISNKTVKRISEIINII